MLNAPTPPPCKRVVDSTDSLMLRPQCPGGAVPRTKVDRVMDGEGVCVDRTVYSCDGGEPPCGMFLDGRAGCGVISNQGALLLGAIFAAGVVVAGGMYIYRRDRG
jgi:hypothetical protein